MPRDTTAFRTVRVLSMLGASVIAGPSGTWAAGTIVADTYIKAGREATRGHGTLVHLDVTAGTTAVTYVKVSLSPAPAAGERVFLDLYTSNGSPYGGRVHRVSDTSWSEGLRWADVDLNADGKLDSRDRAALVPTAGNALTTFGRLSGGQTLRLDVTGAFQDGAGTKTIAITTSSRDPIIFRSSEVSIVSQRPKLSTTTGGPSGPVCGDRVRTAPEQCDGSDDAACPGACRTDCTCGTAPPPPSSACLSRTGPLITLSGTTSNDYRNDSLAAHTRIDAHRATFLASPTNLYPINLGGSSGACLAGGTIEGQYNRSLSWETMHSRNNAGVRFENGQFTIEGIRIDNVTDGIRPIAGPFTIRNAWLSYIRDDCLENDHLHGGLIEDSLFDGCYVAFAERPNDSMIADGADGRNQTLTIRRSLVRLEPMPHPRNGTATDRGHGPFFKWHDLSNQLALHDNVFMAEQSSVTAASSMAIPSRLASCSNNVMVWLGPGNYPTSLPSCFRVTRDRAVWTNAVEAWRARTGR